MHDLDIALDTNWILTGCIWCILTEVFCHCSPWSFTVTANSPHFKVICCQWLELFSPKSNFMMVAINWKLLKYITAFLWFKMNMVSCDIFSFNVLWRIPREHHRWNIWFHFNLQVLNWIWNCAWYGEKFKTTTVVLYQQRININISL